MGAGELEFVKKKGTNMNLINIENITKVYSERKIFDDASFSLQEGEKVGIIGINGTGKSTLLKLIAGEEEADAGSITRANHVKLCYLPQHPVFDPKKSSLGCVLEKNMTEENRWSIEADAKAMMTRLGILDFEQPAGELSGGQRKRLALISALLSPADILLLDEPTNHLDMKTKDILKQALMDFDGTLILVSHDRDFLDGLVSKVYEFGNKRVTEHLSGIYEFLEKKKMDSLRELER